jgi:hypothetical protein
MNFRIVMTGNLVGSDGCGRSVGQVARRAGRVARATHSDWGIAGLWRDKPGGKMPPSAAGRMLAATYVPPCAALCRVRIQPKAPACSRLHFVASRSRLSYQRNWKCMDIKRGSAGLTAQVKSFGFFASED